MKIAPIAFIEFAGGLALIHKPKSLYTVLSSLIKQKYHRKFSRYVWIELNQLNERGETCNATVIWVLKKLRKQVNRNILTEKVCGI